MVYAYSSSSSSSTTLGGQLGRGMIVLMFLTLVSTMMVVNVNAQLNVNGICSTYNDSCDVCLENSSTCVWVPGAGGCLELESCDLIADTSCYSPDRTVSSRMTTQEICSIATMDVSNSNLCNSQSDCTTCIDTILSTSGDDGGIGGSDGGSGTTTTTNTCQWFNFDSGGGIEGYCGHECGMMGCGVFTCDAVAADVDVDVDDNNDNDQIMNNEACESNLSCRDCLSTTSTACGWVNGMGCLESCNIIADVGCYDIENFNFNGNDVMTGDDICTIAENDIADMDLCSSQMDCTTCIETSLLGDGTATAAAAATKSCRWFSDMNFCGSECNMIGCGETTCTTATATADNFTIGDGMEEATTTPPATTTTPSSSSVDAIKSSTAAKKYKSSNYFLGYWMVVVVASCLL